ncbi:MAG: PAS domain-containing protein [Lachnospiraceae bacterium]
MELSVYMKSIIDMDRASVVICDLDHKIIYMNPAAVKRYAKRGGSELVGKSLLNCHNEKSNVIIKKVVAWFLESTDNNMIYTYHNEKENKDVYMVALRDDRGAVIGYYEKHEYRDRETAKLYDFEHPLTI